MVCSSVGSSTMTGWKRRSRAASRSMYLRYSSSVVAPMHWSSPRDSGGLRMLAASMAPSAAPAPTSVCSSSMKRTASFVLRSSSMIFLSRSSNSPRYFVPATSEPMSRVRTRLFSRMSGHVAGDDAVGEALGDGRLADAGLADEGGVVLRLATEDLDDPLDLLLSADDGIQLSCTGGVGEVDAELVDGRGLAGALRLLGGRPGGRALRQDPDDLVADLVEVHAERLQHAGGDPLALADEAQEQVLRADVVVPQPAGLVDGQLDDALRARRQADLADDRAVAATDDELDRRPDLGQLDVHVLEDARGHTLALADEAQEQVLRADVVVVEPLRFVLRECQDLARPVRELVEAIHRSNARSVIAAPRSGAPAMLARHPCRETTVGAGFRHLQESPDAAVRMRRSEVRNRNDPPGDRRVVGVVVAGPPSGVLVRPPRCPRRSRRCLRRRPLGVDLGDVLDDRLGGRGRLLGVGGDLGDRLGGGLLFRRPRRPATSFDDLGDRPRRRRPPRGPRPRRPPRPPRRRLRRPGSSLASSAAAASDELLDLGARRPSRGQLVGRDRLDDRLDRLGGGGFLGGFGLGGRRSTISSTSAAASDDGSTLGVLGGRPRRVSATASVSASPRPRPSSAPRLRSRPSPSASASCWRTWAKAEARVLSIPPSGSWTASDIE